MQRMEASHSALQIPRKRRLVKFFQRASEGEFQTGAKLDDEFAGASGKCTQGLYEDLSNAHLNFGNVLAAMEQAPPRDASAQEPLVQRTYRRGKSRQKVQINEVYESGLEILNEFGSILFTFTSLYALQSTSAFGHGECSRSQLLSK